MDLSVTQHTFQSFKSNVVAAHDGLPPQLQIIAQFILDHPRKVALMTIADISTEIDVQPSAVIRFSKALGFTGFSEIQKILRTTLNETEPASYFARLDKDAQSGSLERFASLAAQSLGQLPDEAQIDAAAHLLTEARTIHVVGMRRAFGIATLLTYMLGEFSAPVHLIAPTGDMVEATLSTVTHEDVMVAISFPNYRTQTISAAAKARRRGCTVIALTNSEVSPLAKEADHVLIVDQPTDGGFRSSAGSIVVTQAIAAAYGRKRTV